MRLKLQQAYIRITDRANLVAIICQSGIVRHQGGQDLIEYALMAATIAVATAAIFPTTVAPNISQIFSRVASSLGAANT